jgi:hypothetical protein
MQFSTAPVTLYLDPDVHSFIHSSMALQLFVGPWRLIQGRNLFYTVGRTPWTRDQPVARPLPTHRTTQTQNKGTQTSMPWVGFEPMIPAFERMKTVHALDGAATVIGGANSLQSHASTCLTLSAVEDHVVFVNCRGTKTAWYTRKCWRQKVLTER